MKKNTLKRKRTKTGKPRPQALELGLSPLTIEDVKHVAVDGLRVTLSKEAEARILRAQEFLRDEMAKGAVMYGVNTGFGLLSNVRIEPSQTRELQVNILRSHAAGVGHAMPDTVVRAMLLLRAHTLAIGHSGVSVGLVKLLIEFLNRGICPIVPQQGSVGASGDLAPLSHLALPLIGEGRARLWTVSGRAHAGYSRLKSKQTGGALSGAQALRATGLAPVKLGPKEGLALINGTQFMTAIGALTLLDAEHLADVSDWAGALSLEALRGTVAAFDPEIHRVRPHPGQVQVAERLRKILSSGGKKSEIAKSHEDCGRVQDPYSLRCMPQVHGASRDTFAWVRQVLEREINSVTDNPLVFPDSGKVLSGGNFHGQIVAIAMDALAIAAAELASISEQRIEKLVNPAISGLPAFLTEQGGLNSGFMLVQVAAASVVSESKTLCHPASVDSIPTSADKEDHVSMGAWAARKAARVVTNSRRVLAMELISAAQGIDLLRPLRSTQALEKLHAYLRKRVKRVDQDRPFHEDIAKVEQMIARQELQALFA